MTKSKASTGYRILAWLSLLGMCAIWVVINVAGDRYWWTVAPLFGPRWIWGIFLLGMLPLTAQSFRRGLLMLFVATTIFVLGILNFRLGLSRLTTPKSSNLRVMQFNAEGDGGDQDKVPRLVSYVTTMHPEILVMVECTEKSRQTLEKLLTGYQVRQGHSICLWTKSSVPVFEVRDPADFWKRSGSGQIIRAEVVVNGRRLRLGLVHLATPRRALSKYNDTTEMNSIADATELNLLLRNDESRAAREWVSERDSLPTIVVGDFNLPVESAIFQRHWGDLQNAFSATGFGLGHTKLVRLWGVRIDHILTDDSVAAVHSWVGPPLGSDHVPLVADLMVKNPEH